MGVFLFFGGAVAGRCAMTSFPKGAQGNDIILHPLNPTIYAEEPQNHWIILLNNHHTSTYGHRPLRTRLPLRSAKDKEWIGWKVVGSVTTSEYQLLYVTFWIFCNFQRGFREENDTEYEREEKCQG